ncbi:MAG: hypothetical protein NT004_17575 [Bacteroidetes bacterium]|nr:hypothetical protein [Bacteroidota bacterium]
MKKIIIFLFLSMIGNLVISQTKTELQASELQKPIKEYIERNFNGFSIGKIFKVDEKGTITFDICVNKGKTYEKLFFDKEGKFMKKESCSHECCMGPQKK